MNVCFVFLIFSAASRDVCSLNSQFLNYLRRNKVPIDACNRTTTSKMPLGVLAENVIESSAEYCANFDEVISSGSDFKMINFARGEASLGGIKNAGDDESTLTISCAKAVAENPQMKDVNRYPSILANALSTSICFHNESNPLLSFIANDRSVTPDIGLRRWLFHPLLKSVSIGRDHGAFCARMVMVPDNFDTSNQLVVFPPPGPFPLSMVNGDWAFSYIGWLGNASATVVNDAGEILDIDVDKSQVNPGMMGMPTITIHRKNIDNRARSYFVLIEIPERIFAYRIRAIDCGGKKSGITTGFVALAMFIILVAVAMATAKRQSEKEQMFALMSPLQHPDGRLH